MASESTALYCLVSVLGGLLLCLLALFPLLYWRAKRGGGGAGGVAPPAKQQRLNNTELLLRDLDLTKVGTYNNSCA